MSHENASSHLPLRRLLSATLLILSLTAVLWWTGRPATAELQLATELTAVSLTSIDGPEGFPLVGNTRGDLAGRSSASVGDINGDGLDDFAVGASAADPDGKQSAGVVYVIFGRTDQPTELQLGAMLATDGFRLVGVRTGDLVGDSVGAAGDVNNDGFDDLIVGAPGSDLNDVEEVGAAYIVYGAPAFSPILYTNQLDGTNGVRLNGIVEGDRVGVSVSGAGDLNQDGYDDVIIGAPQAQAGGKAAAGVAYVVFGQPSLPAVFDLATLNGSNGLRLSGNEADAQTGNAVAAAGDFNRDGFDDVAVAAWKSSKGAKAEVGTAYVVFGRPSFGANLVLNKLGAGDGIKIVGVEQGDRAGRALAGAGDANGDDFDDLLVGAPFADGWTGHAYVVYGSTNPPATIDLGNLNGNNGYRIVGASSNDQTGFSVSFLRDIDGNGLDDLLIGADSAGEGSRRFAGEAYAVLSTGSVAASVVVTDLPATGGVRYFGAVGGDQAGQQVSTAGDVNGDGYDDFLVSAPRSGHGEAESVGHTYLIYGGPTTGLPMPVTHPGTPGNNTLNGTGGRDFMMGHRGDDTVRGLGEADVLIGGQGNDILEGGPAADRLDGGRGEDTASYASSASGVTINLLTHVAQGGDAQGDRIRNIENIIGSSGNDTLTGDTGDNLLDGGGGNDSLTGGLGNDVFRISPDAGADTITDFAAGAGSPDVLDFTQRPGIMGPGDLQISQQGGDALVTLPGGDSIKLLRVSSGSLHSDDYRFGGSPVAASDSYTTTLNTVLSVGAPGVLANDDSNSSSPLTAVLVDPPDNGTVNLRANGSFDYTPANGFTGPDSFTYRADNGLPSNLATVSITVTGVPPTARNDRFSTDLDETLVVPAPGVLANDTNPGNAPLKAVLVQPPIAGTLTLRADGSFDYTPELELGTTDQFTYVATNGLTSEEATVTIEVGSTVGPLEFVLYLPAATAD